MKARLLRHLLHVGRVERYEMADALSREVCETAVGNYLRSSDFVLEDYKVEPFSDKTVGFMGRHLKLTADVQIGGKLQQFRFFVKTVPTTEKHRSMVIDCNLFGTEATAYNEFVPKLNSCLPPGKTLPVPKCYFARGPAVDSGKLSNSSSGNEEVVILEDLTVRGYRCRENCPPMDLPHCHAVLRAMASYHASSILLEDSCRKSKPGDFDPKSDLYSGITENFLIDQKGHMGYECVRFDAESMSTAVFKMWPEKFEGISRDAMMKAVMGKWEEAFEMAKPSSKYPNVLSHGDPWTNNILFRYERDEEGREVPVDALLVDLQMTRYAPPILDILIFLHVCTKRDFRERHLKHLLKFYHEALAENVPKGFVEKELPFERLLEMCDQYGDFGRVISTGYLPIIMSGMDDLKIFDAEPEEPLDINQTMYSDRGDEIARNCIKSKIFKEWIAESFQECLEMLKLWT